MYLCIDLKSFFASVECALRGLNPNNVALAVVDATRGDGAIILAASPHLKEYGVKNRCRLYEIPKEISLITAKPRMKYYIKYAVKIHQIFLKYFEANDIHTYSIDEAFIYVKPYLSYYNISVKQLALKIVKEIKLKLGIGATCGAGDNMYLSKVALDILAKKNGGFFYLNKELYIKKLWNHTPLTDFWQIGNQTVHHLNRLNIYNMKDLAYTDVNILKRDFGIIGVEMYERAWGNENINISDIKEYTPENKSISKSQIFFEDYEKSKAILPLLEMLYLICIELCSTNKDAVGVSFFVGYNKEIGGGYSKAISFEYRSRNYNYIAKIIKTIYEKEVIDLPIRQVGLSLIGIKEIKNRQMSLFKEDDDKYIKLCECIGQIHNTYGKNALNLSTSLLDESTIIYRNKCIGGHNGK